MWNKIYGGTQRKDCLITLGTGTIANEEQVGLIGTHAYGVLEVTETCGYRLLLVKNPWGHTSWKGKFSYGDTKTWTPQLKQALGYENFSEDKGVFWISFDAVLQWFDSLDINWNPNLLPNKKMFFDRWSVADMVQGNFVDVS